MQETKFRRQSARMAKAFAAKYKSLRIGNGKKSGGVGIFLAEVWMEKIIYITRVSNTIMLNKVFRYHCFSCLSLCPQCRLDPL